MKRQPWHGPPHGNDDGLQSYLISAASYQHAPIIGQTPDRMAMFEADLLALCQESGAEVFAWCILPNHYHLLLRTDMLRAFLDALGRFHGRISHQWNGDESCRGRKVWYRCMDRRIKTAAHFWSSINYVHHNPVRHGYVERWQEWAYSSASEFVDTVGRKRALEIWARYTIEGYGDQWDHD